MLLTPKLSPKGEAEVLTGDYHRLRASNNYFTMNRVTWSCFTACEGYLRIVKWFLSPLLITLLAQGETR